MLFQLAVNGVIAGSAYALLALGFGIIYGTTRTFHFAHGAVYTLAGYVFYHTLVVFGAPFFVAASAALAVAALLGTSSEWGIGDGGVAELARPLRADREPHYYPLAERSSNGPRA
jgi:branched-subunit amino acid ABC-type transport system permease component